MRIGVDIGGSLTKIAVVREEMRDFRLLEHTNVDEVARDVDAIWKGHSGRSERSGELSGDVRIFVTGCGARELAGHLRPAVTIVDELDSACAGARHLALEQGLASGDFILTVMGTGTSVFHIGPASGIREAGTGVGGGTIIGLANMLLGTSDFTRILDLAAKGDRRNLDLMVSDLYPDAAESPVLCALTAANFGRMGSSRHISPGDSPVSTQKGRADAASAIVQLAVEAVGVISIQVARTYKDHTIVIAGSPSRHPLIQERFIEIGKHLGHEFGFLKDGAFCGAFGAVLQGQA